MDKLKIKSIVLLIFLSAKSFSQVGIGTLVPTKELDINYVLLLPDLEETEDLDTYNRVVISDNEGNLGYRKRYKGALKFRNTFLEKMEQYVSLPPSSIVDTNLSIEIRIPAKTKSLFEINYSIPVLTYSTGSSNNTSGYVSIFLTRTIGKNKEEVIKEASRRVSFSGTYDFSVAAKGRPVSNFYYDILDNDLDQDIVITYRVKAISSSDIYVVRVGMYNGSSINPEFNYNWGKGAMMINVFEF